MLQEKTSKHYAADLSSSNKLFYGHPYGNFSHKSDAGSIEFITVHEKPFDYNFNACPFSVYLCRTITV